MTKEQLVEELVRDGYLRTPAIIEAFKAIDRADFVPEEYKNESYENYPLSIGREQTISQPLTVAFMLELLEPKRGEKILDVGAGSGWQTALLAQLVGEEGKVIAVERIAELKAYAESTLSKYPFIEKGRVLIIQGDGSHGFETEAPYDKIIAAASGEKLPNAWKEQLKIGGKIVAPFGESIYVFDKVNKDEFIERHYFGFRFVPLVLE